MGIEADLYEDVREGRMSLENLIWHLHDEMDMVVDGSESYEDLMGSLEEVQRGFEYAERQLDDALDILHRARCYGGPDLGGEGEYVVRIDIEDEDWPIDPSLLWPVLDDYRQAVGRYVGLRHAVAESVDLNEYDVPGADTSRFGNDADVAGRDDVTVGGPDIPDSI